MILIIPKTAKTKQTQNNVSYLLPNPKYAFEAILQTIAPIIPTTVNTMSTINIKTPSFCNKTVLHFLQG